MDALGRPGSVLLLGATSDIGQAIARRWADSLVRIVLAGRPSPERAALAAEWSGRGVEVDVVDFDAAQPGTHAEVVDRIFAAGDIDVVVLAFGVLGDQREFESDPSAAAAAADVNFTGAMSSALAVAPALEAQGHGHLVVLSSVAGLRARRSNYVYGATKAGLDTLASGLADRLHGSGCHVLIVRPGFVRTSMTEGLEPAPLSVTADDVAEAVVHGLGRSRRVIYVPATMRVVMLGLRVLPGSVFRRLPI